MRLRYKLSTILIPPTIVAWALSCAPYYRIRYGCYFIFDPQPPRHGRLEVNPQLLWPALGLVAFLAWKAAWAIRGRFEKPAESPAKARSSLSEKKLMHSQRGKVLMRLLPRRMPILLTSTLAGAAVSQLFMPRVSIWSEYAPLMYAAAGAIIGVLWGLLFELARHDSQD